MNNSIAFAHEIIMALGNTTFPHEGMDEYHSYQYAYPNDVRVFLKSLIDSTMRDDEILDVDSWILWIFHENDKHMSKKAIKTK